jgi:hypothetical protein
MFRSVQILAGARAAFVLPNIVLSSPNFFYFLVRRYSDVSRSQVCRKLAAGRELSHGHIQVASEFRLGGGALFVREALFVTSSRGRAIGSVRLADALVAVGIGIGRIAKERCGRESRVESQIHRPS